MPALTSTGKNTDWVKSAVGSIASAFGKSSTIGSASGNFGSPSRLSASGQQGISGWTGNRPTTTQRRSSPVGSASQMTSTQNTFAGMGASGRFGRTGALRPTSAASSLSAWNGTGASGRFGTSFGQSSQNRYGGNTWKSILGDVRSTLPYADQTSTTGGTSSTAGYSGGVGKVATGVNFGQFDSAADADIQRAAEEYGVPANFLKAIVARESSGDWASNSHWVSSVRGGERIYGYVGVFESAAASWGFDFDSLNGDRLGQLRMLASGLRGMYDRSPNHDWAEVASMHFSGKWQPTGWTDELGNNDAQYINQVIEWWKDLDAQAGNQWNNYGGGSGGVTVTGNASQVISVAQSYVGTPYVWGGIPGKGETPTGWDCSGFMYWLDQNYGNGQLVMGSHYQYDQMQREGRLFTDTSQLQPGDLVFFDTGWYGGAGGNMNRAGHVGMYIGNGKFVHAANEQDGTIISDLSGYYGQTFIGAAHMSWSGGTAGYGGGTTGYGNSTQTITASNAWWLTPPKNY